MMKILLVEDDKATGSVLVKTLSDNHHTVTLATDGSTALQLAQAFNFDLVILDIIIPGLDGISVCKQLRNSGYQNPILLLTAKDSSDDLVIGLDAGADDYVVKPFDLPELLARIRALLRRFKSVSSTIITWENLRLDSINSEITCDGQRLHLTPKEYCLLELFLLNPKRIFSRSAILDRLWDFAKSPGEETVSAHIKCLRQKLKAAGASDPIETVHGLGYRLRQPDDLKQTVVTELPESVSSQENLRQKVKQKTVSIWDKHKASVAEQVTILEQASQLLSVDELTAELRQQAQQQAHKLAGSLGIFGLVEGSQLAREVEELLQPQVVLEAIQIQRFAELTKLLRQQLDHPTTITFTQAKPKVYSPLILIVDDDLLLAEQLKIEGIKKGMRVEVATDVTVAQQMIMQTPPDVILLDLDFPSPTENGLTLLQELKDRVSKIPIIVFTGRESLGDRVEVARLGIFAFLHKPLPTDVIFQTITDALDPKQTNSHNRVMLVDDDSVILETLSNYLCSLGCEVTTLNNPQRFWEVLTNFQPNLLVLDMKMPKFNGADLCQAVRTDSYWHNLTVLFLSTYTTAEEVNLAFAVGADDYISKSIDQAEITTRIIRRFRKGKLHTTTHSTMSAD